MTYYQFVLLFILLFQANKSIEWGFEAHRIINRKAVFTLVPDLFGFYKQHIDYISRHAVDADKRRYALKDEFSRHYIDLDQWDVYPFQKIPRDYNEAVLKYGEVLLITEGDSSLIELDSNSLEIFYGDFIAEQKFSSSIEIDPSRLKIDSVSTITKADSKLVFKNKLVEYGVLPYFIPYFYERLVRAFQIKDVEAVLKLSADLGHYISDAHVPLHTTKNYNGQLTGQEGIHAFWESRLPELFAHEEYDFIMDRAEYISNIENRIWEVVLESHALLETVLNSERRVSKKFDEDRQFAIVQTNSSYVRTHSVDYARAYHEHLNGMVEDRMRKAIHCIGSVWYSAWLEAGQPDMTTLKKNVETVYKDKENSELDQAFKRAKIFGRKH